MTCEICQLSEDRHQSPYQAYAAGIGVHAYRETPPGWAKISASARERAQAGCRCATSDRPSECMCPPPNPLAGVHVETPSERPSQRPQWVPAEGGGLTQVWVEETPSDRLPPQSERYSTGRVPLPPVPENTYPPGARELTDQPPWWRRILGSST